MSEADAKLAPAPVTINVFGRAVEARQPSLEELAALRKAGPEDGTALKLLARACIPSFRDLLKEKPGCARTLGLSLLAASGISGPVTELLEEELEPGPMAEGWVEAERKGFRNLHAFEYRRTYGEDDELVLQLILREPKTEHEIDSYLTEELKATAPRRFIKTLCVWGNPSAHEVVARIESVAPGLYVALALIILKAAGLTGDVTLGEA